MPGPLSFLDSQPRDTIVDWLRKALLGKTTFPMDYPDEGIRSVVVSSEPSLEAQTRRDLAHAVLVLIQEIHAGKNRPPAFVEALLGLASDLRLEAAVSTLVALAKQFPNESARLSHGARAAVLFGIANLGIPQTVPFWLNVWEVNRRAFSAPVLAALLDLDPLLALEFLPKLANSADLADLVTINLDYHADQMKGAARMNFLEQAAAIADSCPAKIRESIHEWLAERNEASAVTPRSDTPLARALGTRVGMPATARLCVSR